MALPTGREFVVPVMGLGGVPRGELPSGSTSAAGADRRARGVSPGGAVRRVPNKAPQRRN